MLRFGVWSVEVDKVVRACLCGHTFFENIPRSLGILLSTALVVQKELLGLLGCGVLVGGGD